MLHDLLWDLIGEIEVDDSTCHKQKYKKKKSAKKKENTAKTPNPTNSSVAKENTRKKASKKITSGSEVSAKTEEKE